MKRTISTQQLITILTCLTALGLSPVQAAPTAAAATSPSPINYTFDETPLDRANQDRVTSYADMLDKVTPAVVGVYPSRTALQPRQRGPRNRNNGGGNGGNGGNGGYGGGNGGGGYGYGYGGNGGGFGNGGGGGGFGGGGGGGYGYGGNGGGNGGGFGGGNGPNPQTQPDADWIDAKGNKYWYIGVGSGCIISSDGYILTNNHVVTAENEEPAAAILVKLSDGRELPAKVIGTDKETDLALIKIDAKNLPTMKMADSEKLRVGDIVFAVGNPMDVGTTVTHGIISALGRSDQGLLDEIDPQTRELTSGYEDFIQTDASINPGNSGGPLVDAQGRLVGLNAVIESPSGGSIGIGFAIPSALARHVADDLIKDGKVRRGALGVGPEDVDNLAEALHLPNTHGAVLTTITPDSPADKAGLKPEDVVVKINNDEVDSAGKLRYLIALADPGTTVDLTVFRDGQPRDVKVVLEDRDQLYRQVGELAPARGSSSNTNAPAANNMPASGEVLTGLALTPVTPALRQELSLPADVNGLVVNDVARNSPYAYEFAPGTVIMQVNQHPVATIEDLRAALKPGQLNLFYVNRQDRDGSYHAAIVTDMVPSAGN